MFRNITGYLRCIASTLVSVRSQGLLAVGRSLISALLLVLSTPEIGQTVADSLDSNVVPRHRLLTAHSVHCRY